MTLWDDGFQPLWGHLSYRAWHSVGSRCSHWGGWPRTARDSAALPQGNHSFLRNPSPFAAGGEAAESSFFSLLCSTLAFSSLPTGVSFVAIWSWTWWVLLSKIVAPWKEAKNKLITEHSVFFLVCGHCWFYLKKSLPGAAASSLTEAIVGLDNAILTMLIGVILPTLAFLWFLCDPRLSQWGVGSIWLYLQKSQPHWNWIQSDECVSSFQHKPFLRKLLALDRQDPGFQYPILCLAAGSFRLSGSQSLFHK